MSRTSVFALFIVAACATNPPSGITEADIACAPDSNLTYENFGKLSIADNCLMCHKSDAKPALNTLAEIQQNRSAIISTAVIGTQMPKNTNMVVEDRQFLGEWLSCGAP